MKVSIDNFGRILIPQKIRRHLDLMPGSVLDVEEYADKLTLKIAEQKSPLKKRGGLLIFTGKIAAHDKDIVRLVKEQRQLRDRHVI